MKVIRSYHPKKLKDRGVPIFLVDFSWLLCNSYYVYRSIPKYTIEKRYIGDILSFIERINLLMDNYPTSVFIFCMDGLQSFRKELYPEYKAGRKRPDDLWNNYKEIVQILAGMKVLFAFNDAYEADDVMFTLTQEYKRYLSPVYLYTSDQDLDPYLTDNIQTGVVKFTKIQRGAIIPICLQSRKDVLGYHPSAMIGVKTIVGDPHNNVKGFKYFQKKSAEEIYNWELKSGISIMEMIQGTFPDNFPSNLIKMIKKRSEIEGSVELTVKMLERNQRLATLVKVPKLRLVQLEGSFDPLQHIANLIHRSNSTGKD